MACEPTTKPGAAADAPAAASARPTTAARPATATAALRRQFEQWQQQQISAGRFTVLDSCASYRKQLAQHPDEEIAEQYAFPLAEEFNYSYADLNQDGQLDGLMTFTPEQCDGGNGSMWSQEAVLLLSEGPGYRLNDTINLEHLIGRAPRPEGFYHLDSIALNRLYGTYMEFGPGSGYCCPSLMQSMGVDFARRQVVSRGPNTATK